MQARAFHRKSACEEPGCRRVFFLGGRHHCRACGRSVCSLHFSRPYCSVCLDRSMMDSADRVGTDDVQTVVAEVPLSPIVQMALVSPIQSSIAWNLLALAPDEM